MAAKLVIAPEVEQDLAESYTWYENRRLGLGEEFLGCVDACIESIRRTPEIYEVVYDNYRRGLVRRFPFEIFYEYADNVATVYSVFHCSRDPEKWRQNLR